MNSLTTVLQNLFKAFALLAHKLNCAIKKRWAQKPYRKSDRTTQTSSQKLDKEDLVADIVIEKIDTYSKILTKRICKRESLKRKGNVNIFSVF